MALSGAASASELDDAVRSRDFAALRRLLDSEVDLDKPARDALTPLLWASQANDLELVRTLLEAGADANTANRYGVTPLWLAATNRSPALVELLLGHGADASAAMPHGETALMAAARAGDADSIRILIEAGADPNAAETTLGETGLMWAAAENHPEAIAALIAGGADPDQVSSTLDLAPMDWVQVGMVSTVLPVGGWVALTFAARENARDAAIALIDSGANPNAQDPDGNTPLLIALANDHYDLAAALLEAGADPNVTDRTGVTALHAAVERKTATPDFGRPAVPDTDVNDAFDIVRLALEHGADIEARLSSPTLARHHGFPDRSLGVGGTPLMRAVQRHDLDTVDFLLGAGASAGAVLDDGSSVMHVMASARASRSEADAAIERQLLDLLIAAGADIEATATDGQLPMHRAARSGNASFIELLFEYGARLDPVDAEGHTPADIVTMPGRSNNPKIAGLLSRLAAGE
jgi:ankyrin repeat protein